MLECLNYELEYKYYLKAKLGGRAEPKLPDDTQWSGRWDAAWAGRHVTLYVFD